MIVNPKGVRWLVAVGREGAEKEGAIRAARYKGKNIMQCIPLVM